VHTSRVLLGELAETGIDLAIKPLVRHPYRAVAVRLGQLRPLDQLHNGRVAKQ